MECWSGGVVEWWSGGVVECWSVGVVEWWSGGVQIARLRRELEFITRQRDILKKALGILGQDPWNSSK
jgi:hypothetical protein